MVTATEIPANATVIQAMPGPQDEFICSTARYPGFFGGVGSGKTAGLQIKVMYDFQTWGSRRAGMMAMYSVPTMTGAQMFFLPKWRELYRDFEGILWTWHEKQSVIRFPQWDGTMFLRPAGEPDAPRGAELARVYMDEIASEAIGSQEEFFRVSQGRIRQKGFGPNQIAVVTSPKVCWRWIVQRWQEHVNPLTGRTMSNAGDYPAFYAQTEDNFHLDADYKQSLIDEWEGTRWGEQELHGRFISIEGLGFEMLDPAVHYVWPAPETEFVRTVYGFDPGVTSPTAIIEWKQDRLGRKWATDEFYKRDADEYDWIRWLADRNATRVICDQAVSEKQREYWQRRYGIRFVPAQFKSFHERVEIWRTGLRCDSRPPTVFVTPACPNTWNELLNLTFERPRGQEYNADKWARGTPDHGFDAGSYGLGEFEAFRGRPPAPNVIRMVA